MDERHDNLDRRSFNQSLISSRHSDSFMLRDSQSESESADSEVERSAGRQHAGTCIADHIGSMAFKVLVVCTGMQMDNFLHSCEFPVVLHSVPPPKPFAWDAKTSVDGDVRLTIMSAEDAQFEASLKTGQ